MPVTVRKIVDLDIFKTKTRLVAGANGLDNVITYITIMESPDFYEWVNGGEFVLTTWYAYSQHPELQVPGFRRLAEKIAAIGIKIGRHINEVPPEIITIANEYAVPVFAINRETKHREIIQAVAAELNNYQTNLLLEVNKHYLELARIALAGGDFTPMLRGLGRRMGVPCFCLNQDFRVLGSYLPEGHGRVNLPALAEQVRQVINQAPNGSLYHQIKDLHIFTCTARQQPVGYLVLVTPQKLSKKNELMANQLVTFLTLKLFDQLDTEQKILISLWDDILYKRYLSEPQLRERLSLYGLKAYHAFQVVVLLPPVTPCRTRSQASI